MTSLIDILAGIIHPAQDKDIVSLGLVNELMIFDKEGSPLDATAAKVDEKIASIKFKLVFPSPDPLAGTIKKDCEDAIKKAFPNAELSIMEMVRPRKTKKTVNDLDDKELNHVKNIIAVASGKGGVGKSTVAVNLAVALARKGFKVGLVDADIYGPSIPKMTGTEDEAPSAIEPENDTDMELIVPIEKWGIKLLSIGHIVEPSQALIWRGPMACNALRQIVLQVKWGELDYLLIDLPPGTGDIHISMVHDIPLTGAVIVTTPQDVAITDVVKSINMFRHKDINIPIYGLVENMAWFTPAELPNNKYYIFGKEGGKKMAEKLGIKLLGSIPIYMSIREGGDKGEPVAFSDSPDGKAFMNLADQIAAK